MSDILKAARSNTLLRVHYFATDYLFLCIYNCKYPALFCRLSALPYKIFSEPHTLQREKLVDLDSFNAYRSNIQMEGWGGQVVGGS